MTAARELLAAEPPRWFTVGPWATEEASAAAFDARVAATGMFRTEREVRGTLIQPRAGQLDRSLRIDRILFPGPALRDLGWPHGAIGIELKRAGENIGPPLAQAMDYVRGTWEVAGVLVQVSAVFLWPVEKQSGPLASLMCNCRIGTVTPDGFKFALGEEVVFADDRPYGSIRIGGGRSGRKVGSR